MSAAQPPAERPSAPTTQTLATPRLPLALRLIGRSSAPGAAVVAGIALLLVGGVPLLATALEDNKAGDEEASAAGGTVELSLAAGWSVADQSAGITTLTHGSATLTIETVPGGDGIASLAQEATDVLEADESANWVINTPAEYTTDDGHPGATVTATSETRSAEVWVADYDAFATVAILTAPVEAWAAALPGATEIVGSLTVTTSTGTGAAQGTGP
ncbi:hypothetical protein [Demequina sp.]|uniref:hypothetical protein n=1 Tax=Demequina sp. TaxID=2050685 RepID=UPI003A87BE60